ncbi:hypothetical protein LINPERHAP1_LOCUS21471, partial [Linum perenne]
MRSLTKLIADNALSQAVCDNARHRPCFVADGLQLACHRRGHFVTNRSRLRWTLLQTGQCVSDGLQQTGTTSVRPYSIAVFLRRGAVFDRWVRSGGKEMGCPERRNARWGSNGVYEAGERRREEDVLDRRDCKVLASLTGRKKARRRRK